jgi:drug/metabolite transporter (DMT)-like permease
LLFWKQKASQKTWLLTTAAILCSALIAAGGMRSTQLTPQAPKGVALIMAAAVLFAAATLLGKELLARVTPILLIWLRMAIAAVTLLAIQTPTLLRVLPGLKTQDLIALILIGIVHSGLANWLFYKGLKSSSALFAGLVQLLGPVSGLTTGYLLLGEKPSLPQFAGILGLLAVLYLLAQPGQRIAMPVAPAPAQK